MPEFFLELFSEEIPARMQRSGALLLSIAIHNSIPELIPVNQHLKTYFSPRRIAVVGQAAGTTKSISRKERGPRIGAPEQAVSGFLRKFEASREQLIEENNFFVLPIDQPERQALDIITNKLPAELARMPWLKSMRWGQSGDFTWVRPLRRIVCLLDGEIIPLTLGPIVASNESEGHRVLTSGLFTVLSVGDWKEKLRTNYVIADQDERRKIIANGVTDKAAELGLSVAEDDALLDEVTGLVEWPVALIGEIDEQFMDLPWEVRELSMKVNQKYFALRDAEGKPAPYFAFVANLEAPDGGAAIVAGNERVLRARLSDARHFWDLDLKTPLDELLPKLDKITFHAKIGTQRERADRIKERAGEIAHLLGADGNLVNQARHAGLLCKADLVTGMVGEFPELQGIMGGYYAEKTPRGWDGALVGQAIRSHYQPKGPKDAVPSGPVQVSVALADKLDTLREFFRVGETPTGSGDPYALRRAALGVIRTILENDLRLPLRPLLNDDAELLVFLMERLRVMLRGQGERFDVLDAVLAASHDDDLVRLMKRVHALNGMLGDEDGKNLLAAYRRAGSILAKEEARDGATYHQDFDEALISEPAEAAFVQEQRDVWMRTSAVDGFIAREDFPSAMTRLASLRPAVDRFFDEVTVNVADPILRRNRLRMLSQFIDRVDEIADFSKLEG